MAIEVKTHQLKLKTEDISILEKTFYDIICEAKDNGMWNDAIKIVITDDYKNDINKQAQKWGYEHILLTNEKEYKGVSKILSSRDKSNTKHHIYIPIELMTYELIDFRTITKTQISSVISIIETTSRIEKLRNKHSKTSYFFISDMLCEWIPTWHKANLDKKWNSPIAVKHDTYLKGFKRLIKRAKIEYNSFGDSLNEEKHNARIQLFANKYFKYINEFIQRLIENDSFNKSLHIKDENVSESLYKITEEVESLSKKFLNNDPILLDNLTNYIQEFSERFNIKLTLQKNNEVYIKLIKNSKNIFQKDSDIIDTEPRIVCFMDILGFSNFINDYEDNRDSTLLQSIQKAFDKALKLIDPEKYRNLIVNDKFEINEMFNTIEYKTFSDNICVSIPYFDNKDDFLISLSLMVGFVKSLQFSLMYEGFFTRGGISIGTYFSDDHMIFSSGLVNAYKIEKDVAKYPRLVLDNEIINKIRKWEETFNPLYGLSRGLIVDNENIVFINPFDVMNSAKDQIESSFKLAYTDMPEVNKIVNSLKASTINLFDSQSQEYEKQLKEIYHDIIRNINNNTDQKILKKYRWLSKFAYWVESKEVENSVEFQYFSDWEN